MDQVIRVGMAEMAVSQTPAKLITLGLGSCIGACFYDPISHIGGLLHLMLPSSSFTTGLDNPAKYADTGIPFLIKEMERFGADQSKFWVKLVGGAEMFKIDCHDERLRIGARNIEAVEEICRKFHISVIAKSVGGNIGKSVTFDLMTGIVQIRMVSGSIIL